MRHEQTLQEVEAKLTQSYVEQFRQHTQEVRTHLAGKTADELHPSFIPPAGYWTSAEKDLFFRGICTYSRLRPDLIAESIGTKSLLDVCTYIDILESASARAPTQNSDSGTKRVSFEIAMEMSRSWTKWENGQASALASAEPLWEAAETERLQEAALAEVAATVPSELSREAFLAWKADREVQWSTESVLNNLGKYHLKLMDTVLNDGKPEPGEDVQISDGVRHRDGAVGSPEPSAPATSATAVRAAADSVHRHSDLDTNSSPRIIASPSSLKRRAATPPGEEDAAEMNDADLASMSPTSRRRFQKRLYMRRKRAELAGGTVDTTTEKFKPGRKRKERLPRPRPKAYATKKQQRISKKPKHDSPLSEGEEGSSSQSEPTAGGSGAAGDTSTLDDNPTKSEGDYAHPHIGGITQPYKVKTELESLGLINQEELRAAELDFFRLAPLSRMMNAQRAPSGSETFIAANTIRLLKKIVTEFITRLVQLSIVAQEQEARLKADKKVWRMPSTPIVTAPNVVLAADMMGVPTLNQRSSEIRSSGNDLDASAAPANQSSTLTDNPRELGSDEEDSDAEDSMNPLFQYSDSLCSQLNPAFVRLPRSIGKVLSIASGQDRTVEDVDEDLLELELEEEEYLNEQDKLVEQAFEKELWKIIGGSIEL